MDVSPLVTPAGLSQEELDELRVIEPRERLPHLRYVDEETSSSNTGLSQEELDWLCVNEPKARAEKATEESEKKDKRRTCRMLLR